MLIIRNAQAGYSLLELITVVVIAGIMLSVAVPSMLYTIRNNRLAAYTNDLTTTLMLARAEAVKRNLPVGICRSANSGAATPSCTSGGAAGWEIGWFVFADANRNSAFDAGEPVLMRRDALSGSVTVSGNNNVANRLFYTTQGIVGTAGMGTFTLQDSRPAPDGVRTICVAVTGRPRLLPAGTTACS